MRKKYYISFLFIFLFLGCNQNQQINHKLILIDRSQIDVIKKRIESKLPEYNLAYALLVKEANNILVGSSSSNRITFVSENTEAPIHLASFNEGYKQNKKPYQSINAVMKNVWVLVMAWIYSNDEVYAQEASSILSNVFIYPSTKLNPKTVFEKYINDYEDGSIWMIYEFNSLILIADAVNILETSQTWTNEDSKIIKEWYVSITQSMTNEIKEFNIHFDQDKYAESFFAQMMCFDFFIGSDSVSQQAISNFKNKALYKQHQLYKEQNTRQNISNISILAGKQMLAQQTQSPGLEVTNFEIRMGQNSEQSSFTSSQLEYLQIMLLITEGAFDLAEGTSLKSIYNSLKSNHRVLLFPV